MINISQTTKKERRLNREALLLARHPESNLDEYPLPPFEWLINSERTSKTLDPTSALAILLKGNQAVLRQLKSYIDEACARYDWFSTEEHTKRRITALTERLPALEHRSQLLKTTKKRLETAKSVLELIQKLKNEGIKPATIEKIFRAKRKFRANVNRKNRDAATLESKVQLFKQRYDRMEPRDVESKYLPEGQAVGIEIEWIAPCLERDGEHYQDSRDFVYPNQTNFNEGIAPWIYGTSWGYDSSIENFEEYQYNRGQEARIMLKYGKWKRLRELCNYIVSNGGEINKSCGLHVHLDVRDLSNHAVDTRCKRLQSALPWLLELVPTSRRNNRYCRPEYSSSNKYAAITTHNLRYRRSIEVRMHSATLNAQKIINWVDLLHFIKNRYTHLPTFDNFLQCEAPFHLKEWAINRRTKFATPTVESADTESEQVAEVQ